MPGNRLLLVAVSGEGLLAVLALVWIRARGFAVEAGEPVTGLVLGLGAAVVLAAYVVRGAAVVEAA